MGERLRLATGRGPLGTGVFLIGGRTPATDEWSARPWVCLLSLPILPLRHARFRGPRTTGAGEVWEVEREGLAQALRSDVPRVLGGALVALAMGLGPGWYAWTAIHQTGLVEAFRVVIAVAAPILVLMWRDLGAPRVLR